jgi:fatty-acyl-CoA synthase
MASETIQELLRERASSDTVAVKYGDQRWTWREHMREASARAAALLALAEDRPQGPNRQGRR